MTEGEMGEAPQTYDQDALQPPHAHEMPPPHAQEAPQPHAHEMLQPHAQEAQTHVHEISQTHVQEPPQTHPEETPRAIDHRRERICVQTEGHQIEGYVTLARDGFRSRVSDMLNASERDFLTLTDATVRPLDGGPRENHRFLAVARRHIVFAVVAESAEG